MAVTGHLSGYPAQEAVEDGIDCLEHITSVFDFIIPAAARKQPDYRANLDLENPPENLMAGMTGEMNIITGSHENALILPTRAIVVDQSLIVRHGIVQSRTVKVGYRTLDFSEILEGLAEGDRAILSEQDKLRPGKFVRQRVAKIAPRPEQK